MRRSPLAVLALAAACAGDGARAALDVSEAFMFAPVTQGEAAAYFRVDNRGTAPDTLVALTSPIAASVMVHRQAVEGGMARMEHVDVLPIAPGESLVLAPGGLHAMFVALDRLPVAGDSVTLLLRFARAGERRISLPVRAYGDAP